jgi:hypothetical protein
MREIKIRITIKKRMMMRLKSKSHLAAASRHPTL